MRPDSGTVIVHGAGVWANPAAAKRIMGVLPDRLRLFDRLTGAQLLYYSGVLRGLMPQPCGNASADLTTAFGLDDAVNRLVADYSAGMTKKVALAAAMIHSPRLLVLDEPFESVDPVSAANIIDILQNYTAAGGTVVLSSHSMDLIQRICDSVAIIVAGRLLASGTMRRGARRCEPRRPVRRTRRRTQGGGRHGMVAQFLGLKLRLLANLFRRSPWQVVGSCSASSTGWASRCGWSPDWSRCGSPTVRARPRRGGHRPGAIIVLGFLVLPLVFGVDDVLDPRRFALFGIPNRTLAGALAVSALIGVPVPGDRRGRGGADRHLEPRRRSRVLAVAAAL